MNEATSVPTVDLQRHRDAELVRAFLLTYTRVLVPDKLSSPVEGWSERWLAFWVEAPLLDQSVMF